ncbi:MAG: hypothetical protein HYX32_05665 [Actinobacteria bacterium]|nr:hypothetical protein [Actinomycetota bacterium]
MPGEEPLLDGNELARMLTRLAAETRADDAAASRRRVAWLGRQAEEEATLGGVLLDLSERARPIAVQTASGRVHRGWVEAVGEDFVAVRTESGTDALVRFDGVGSVRSQPGGAITTGDRPLVVDASLVTVLRSLGPWRPRLVLCTGPKAEAVAGELRWVGADVTAIRLDGGGGLAYVPLAAISEVYAADRLIE